MDSRSPPPALARDRWSWIVLIGAFASALHAHHSWYDAVGDTTDASMYIACARSLLASGSYAYLGEPFLIRPPGFALLLVPWIASGASFGALNALGAASAVLLALATFAWARRELGSVLAATLALALAANPGVHRLQNQVLSDLPGACLLVVGLLLARRAEARASACSAFSRAGSPASAVRSTCWRADLALALFLGAACYVRTQLALLAPAVIAARVLAERPKARELLAFARRNALLAIVPVLVLAPWNVRNALVDRGEPADQTLLYSYSTAMWRSELHDPSSPRLAPSEILARVPTRAREVFGALGDRMRGNEPDGASIALGAAFCALALAGALWRRGPADLFWLATLALMLVYFGFQTRLVLPLALIGLVRVGDLLSTSLALLTSARAARLAPAAALIALAALDWAPRAHWSEIESRHASYAATARGIASSVPADRPLASTAGWHLAVFAKRPIHSLLFALRHGGPEAAEALLDRHAIEQVVVLDWSPQDRPLASYLESRYVARPIQGPARVFRVRAPLVGLDGAR